MFSFEVFHSTDYPDYVTDEGEPLAPGWYYWFCQPGCLPDSEPIGPFRTSGRAEAAAEAEIEEYTSAGSGGQSSAGYSEACGVWD